MVELAAVKTGIDVLEKLGYLEKLSLKLISNPDKAARHLNLALAELDTGYNALHNELLELSTLSFTPDKINETHRRLLRVKDGRVADELRSVKGSCSRILNIYDRFLTGWFSNALKDKDEEVDLRNLFVSLGDMDGDFINAVEQLSSEAQQFAVDVLTYLDKGKTEKAQELAKGFEEQLAPIRAKLTKSMNQLWNLQDEFIKIGRAVER